MSEPIIKKWYQKKRYYLPLAIVGVLTIIGLSGTQPNNNSTQKNTPTKQQVKDTITIPAYQEPLKVIQEQPKTDSQPQNVQSPPQQTTPNYYINSAGNKIQSPTKYDSVPAGASARCRDGTYSFSQNRRGTCSHHGGVSDWLY